ncbi:CopG family transcriptional regulator [Nocardia seriolae]|uniref:Importin subunit alpha n=1 Tax=Nocardia seriolae TaxID=37332 RepID=A0A0B8NA58_9NOCA|nr:CopG family transcriptional regulator [Nocardia seriolae]APA97939.1 hypothetical protein NS506_03890 [Nocardia seriolae]MTJ64321.1 ribbon-helix-helix protein, CopG family [Nocardia seriolae]MTJ74092.1 ribbon-helix-helix protein, CopG family [Nocardia seriolae]MTJ87684.1 ribbon-helix-helix protein, CopG family [Nocardia seriolae]MTK31678.1 ribbon-helix-helix protein, CopG family [Nocardia seriolae]
MTDPANDFDNMNPEQIMELTARLKIQTDQAQVLLPPEGAESELANIPRSVKLTATQDRRLKNRARERGMSQSEYIRWLIEQDLNKPVDRPLTMADLPMIVELVRARAA